MEELKIVFEDNHIIVLIKPQNVLSQGDETGDESLVDMLKTYLKEKYHKQGNVFVGCVHRLDRPTGGLMIFAKTSKAAERLTNQIKEGQMEKTYLTCLNGTLTEKSGVLENYLEKDELTNTTRVLDYAKKGAKLAQLSYKVLEEKQNLSLVETKLITGRGHQIRVQFANMGNAVFGDVKYKGDSAKGHNLALWSYKLKFIHPVSKTAMVFISFPSSELIPWKIFDTAKNDFKKLSI